MAPLSHRRTAPLVMPGIFLFFGLTVVLFRTPFQYPLIVLLFLSFVIMTAVLVSLELGSVFAVLASVIELGACLFIHGHERAWLAGQVGLLWAGFYGVYCFLAREGQDEHLSADGLRDKRRELMGLRKEEGVLKDRLSKLENQTALRQHLSNAVHQLAGLKDPILVRQRLMELVRSSIRRGTVHFFSGRSPRDAMDQWVMEKKCPVLVTDTEQDSRFQPVRAGSEVRSVLAAPVVSEGQVVGLIRLNGFEPRLYSTGDLRVLESLSTLASVALGNLQLSTRIEENATQDSLTGLHSLRYFRERLADEILRAGRYRTGFCLLIVEISRFKQYVKTYGSPACDGVVARVSQLLQSCVRPVDFGARYRDGAYAWLLPQTSLSEASAIANAMRQKITAENFSFGPEMAMQERVRPHIGMVAFPDDAATSSQLLRLAEEHLVADSRAGGPYEVIE